MHLIINWNYFDLLFAHIVLAVNVIQSQCGLAVCFGYKCVVGEASEQGTFADAIVSAEDNLLFGYANRCHSALAQL